MTINTDELEDWALRAAQALQEIVDETETSEGTSDCCHDIKALLGELDQIVAGLPLLKPAATTDRGAIESGLERNPDTKVRAYLTRTEAAEYLQANGIPMTVKTLAKLACVGGGPKYQIFGNRALYKPEVLLPWAESRMSVAHSNTSEPSGRNIEGESSS